MRVAVGSEGGATIRAQTEDGVYRVTVTGLLSSDLLMALRVRALKRLAQGHCIATILDVRNAILTFELRRLDVQTEAIERRLVLVPRAVVVSPVVYAAFQPLIASPRAGRERATFTELDAARAWIASRLVCPI